MGIQQNHKDMSAYVENPYPLNISVPNANENMHLRGEG